MLTARTLAGRALQYAAARPPTTAARCLSETTSGAASSSSSAAAAASDEISSAAGSEERPLASVVDHPSPNTSADVGKGLFVVIQMPGRQYKVTVGDQINAQKIPQARVGEPIVADQVLLVGSPDRTVVGRPTVPGASVTLWVEEQTLDEKLWVFHRKRKKNSQKMNGHRAHITMLRVASIDPGPDMGLPVQEADWLQDALAVANARPE